MALFITLEGGEGAGKSTQSKLLAERLGSCILTREPGGTPAAEWIRAFILEGKAKAWGDEAEAVLFAAARLSHVTQKIKPALNANKNVICDRFYDSTRVYQSSIHKSVLQNLEKAAAGDCHPHLTFLIDIPAEIGLERAALRGKGKDRFEGEALNFHQTLRQNFLKLAEANPKRIKVIDGTKSQEEVHAAVWHHVESVLNA